jgi:hypothetical protein
MNINSLYHQPSGLRTKNLIGAYTEHIGEGLFSHLKYMPLDVIATYVCEEISADEGQRRTDRGKGKYLIKVSIDKVLNSRPAYLRGECIASYANSFWGCFNIATGKKAKENATLKVGWMNRQGTWRAQLVAGLRDRPGPPIEPGPEIVMDYEAEYVYPARYRFLFPGIFPGFFLST